MEEIIADTSEVGGNIVGGNDRSSPDDEDRSSSDMISQQHNHHDIVIRELKEEKDRIMSGKSRTNNPVLNSIRIRELIHMTEWMMRQQEELSHQNSRKYDRYHSINKQNTIDYCCYRYGIPIELRRIIINTYFRGYPMDNISIRPAVDLWHENQKQAILKYGHISGWDTSAVLDMSNLFKDKIRFNENIEYWDVSNVISMKGLFHKCSNFNQPLSKWNVQNVRTMHNLFAGARRFNQPINDWNVSLVENMEGMFNDATSFNQPLDKWNILKAENQYMMFSGATNFNQPLSAWTELRNATYL